MPLPCRHIFFLDGCADGVIDKFKHDGVEYVFCYPLPFLFQGR